MVAVKCSTGMASVAASNLNINFKKPPTKDWFSKFLKKEREVFDKSESQT